MEGVNGKDGVTEFKSRADLVAGLKEKNYIPSLIAQIVVRLEYVGRYVCEAYPTGEITELHTEWSFRSRCLEGPGKVEYRQLDAEYLIQDWIDAGDGDVHYHR